MNFTIHLDDDADKLRLIQMKIINEQMTEKQIETALDYEFWKSGSRLAVVKATDRLIQIGERDGLTGASEIIGHVLSIMSAMRDEYGD